MVSILQSPVSYDELLLALCTFEFDMARRFTGGRMAERHYNFRGAWEAARYDALVGCSDRLRRRRTRRE
jgi:hypothetical protein